MVVVSGRSCSRGSRPGHDRVTSRRTAPPLADDACGLDYRPGTVHAANRDRGDQRRPGLHQFERRRLPAGPGFRRHAGPGRPAVRAPACPPPRASRPGGDPRLPAGRDRARVGRALASGSDRRGRLLLLREGRIHGRDRVRSRRRRLSSRWLVRRPGHARGIRLETSVAGPCVCRADLAVNSRGHHSKSWTALPLRNMGVRGRRDDALPFGSGPAR